MKRSLIILYALILVIPAFSQNENYAEKKSGDTSELKTLFGKKQHHCKLNAGYFIELNGGYSRFGDRNMILPGMSFGMILNHHWTIGLTGSFVAGDLDYHNFYYNETDAKWQNVRLIGGYGGVLLEYILLPKSVVHVSFPLTIGGGYLAYMDRWSNVDYAPMFNSHYQTVDYSAFFAVEPGVKMEINLLKKLRIGLGVSYRYVPNLNLRDTPKDRFSQFNARLSLRIGKF